MQDTAPPSPRLKKLRDGMERLRLPLLPRVVPVGATVYTSPMTPRSPSPSLTFGAQQHHRDPTDDSVIILIETPSSPSSLVPLSTRSDDDDDSPTPSPHTPTSPYSRIPSIDSIPPSPFCLEALDDWLVVRGDMVGDRIVVGQKHLAIGKALEKLVDISTEKKFVIAVCGPSGSGKSEVASVLGSRLTAKGHVSYVLSCDNYPHLPPRDNEQRRKELFKQGGEEELRNYLGTATEIDFRRLDTIIQRFKEGDPHIPLRIIDNSENAILDEMRWTDMSDVAVLVLEGTWSGLVQGVDIRAFLDTDFEGTLEHRRRRARDPLTEFGERVLRIEQVKLVEIRAGVDFVIAPDASLVRMEKD